MSRDEANDTFFKVQGQTVISEVRSTIMKTINCVLAVEKASNTAGGTI